MSSDGGLARDELCVLVDGGLARERNMEKGTSRAEALRRAEPALAPPSDPHGEVSDLRGGSFFGWTEQRNSPSRTSKATVKSLGFMLMSSGAPPWVQ